MSKEFKDIEFKDIEFKDEFEDIPLSESNVSLKLEAIRRRCSELLDEPDLLNELSLEESDDMPIRVPGRDPYNHS